MGRIAVAFHRAGNGDHGATLKPASQAFDPQHISKEEWGREWEAQGSVVAVYRPVSGAAGHAR